jgi:hypothetical protein
MGASSPLDLVVLRSSSERFDGDFQLPTRSIRAIGATEKIMLVRSKSQIH